MYTLNDEYVTHVPTHLLIEDYRGLIEVLNDLRFVSNDSAAYDRVVEEINTVMECLAETVDRFTEAPTGMHKPSVSSLIVPSCEPGIVVKENGEEYVCAGKLPVSKIMEGGVCQCPDDCQFRSQCEPETLVINLSGVGMVDPTSRDYDEALIAALSNQWGGGDNA